LSKVGRGVQKSTVMVVDKPYKRKNTKRLSIDNKIHSLDPSKMGEVELEERKLRREHSSCQQLKGRLEIHSYGGGQTL
jgi:hypothetical protein